MDLRSYITPHNIGNLFLAAIFFPLKTIPPFCNTLFSDCQLELREWELLTFLGCVIVMKNRKTSSYSGYIRTVMMMSKLLSLVLFMRHDFLYGCLFALLCILHMIMLPEPCYRGPQQVSVFRGPNMQAELERDKRVTWLIEMHATWSPNCSHFGPVFAELSHKFSLDNLKFGKIDVNRFPEVAKQYNINTSTWSKQLPTVLLFQQGKETRRRPLMDIKGRVLSKFTFTKENMLADFQLSDLHMTCKKNPLSSHKKKKEAGDAGGGVGSGGVGGGDGVAGGVSDGGGVGSGGVSEGVASGDGGGGGVSGVSDGGGGGDVAGCGASGGGGDVAGGGVSDGVGGGVSDVGGVSDGGIDLPTNPDLRMRNTTKNDDNGGKVVNDDEGGNGNGDMGGTKKAGDNNEDTNGLKKNE